MARFHIMKNVLYLKYTLANPGFPEFRCYSKLNAREGPLSLILSGFQKYFQNQAFLIEYDFLCHNFSSLINIQFFLKNGYLKKISLKKNQL